MADRIHRYFTAIAQHRSIRDAAEVLNVAQSALSRQIAKLEQDLGAEMFTRHPRGITLTPAGEVYLRYARDQLAQENSVRTELDALRGLSDGTLRIHAIESLARSLLPRLLVAFRTRRPGIHYHVTIAGSDEIAGMVREVGTDIGISYYSQPSPDIEIRAIAREPLVAIVAASHPLAGRSRIDLQDATAFPIALTEKKSRSRSLIETACWQAGVAFSPVLETNSVELLTGFVEHGTGITFLLRYSALDGIRSRTLAVVPVRSDILNFGAIEALTRASRRLPPVGEEFLAFLANSLAGTEIEGGSALSERVKPL